MVVNGGWGLGGNMIDRGSGQISSSLTTKHQMGTPLKVQSGWVTHKEQYKPAT
jgi:hypothetical protein